MTPERVSRLEALPGWVWEVETTPARKRDWEESFALLLQYAAREGHARVPHMYVEGDQNLGSWVSSQRTAYRNRAPRMTPERASRLEAVPGWVWDIAPADRRGRRLNTRSWDDYFAALMEYVAREGHARVPHSHVEGNKTLGSWVRSQRTAYKHRTAAMTPERIARLEELPGWVWSAKVRADPGWHEHFRSLEQFVAREGHARVPGHHVEEGRKLGVWVSNQRAEYRQQKTSMTPERIERLEAVPGWSWNLREQAWEDGLSRLQAFIGRYGDTRVPRKHVEEDGYRLGQWVYEQKKLYRTGKLAEDRALRLASLPGWRWARAETEPAL